MKKLITIALAVFLILCTGCTPGNEEITALEVPEATVEYFFSALQQGDEIQLEPEIYELKESITLSDLNDVTIHGNGAQLLIRDSDACPLVLENCTNLILEDITISHSGILAEASIILRNCSGITAARCTFTGNFHDSLYVLDCKDVTVDQCIFENVNGLTGEPIGINDSSILMLEKTEDIAIRDCELTGNQAAYLFKFAQSENVLVSGNSVRENRCAEAAFRFQASFPILEANTFEENKPWSWYYPGSEYALNPMGAEILPAMLSLEEPVAEPGPQTEIHVNTMDEFLAAIGPDTKIILDCELMDLNTGDFQMSSAYYFWEDTHDGPQLVITEADNLTIQGAGTISAVPRYADVQSFRFCDNLTLKGFTAGHTVEPGSCMGGVLDCRDCRNVKVDSCGLYGSGIIGIDIRGSENVTVIGCDIYECSDGGIYATDLDGLTIESTTFRDLGGPDVMALRCKNALRDGTPVNE